MSPDVTHDTLREGSTADAILAKAAVNALREELAAYPKPGLVSPIDSGSHADMDFALMCRSADSLFEPFKAMAAAGRQGQSFDAALKPLGIEAERRMLAATDGVNTHRGAIFSMGLMVAAVARTAAQQAPLSADAIRRTLTEQWGEALHIHAAHGASAASHGAMVRRATGRDGARKEAALAFPSVFEVALPAYRQASRAGLEANAACIHTLFTLMEAVDDTTILYRGGVNASAFVRNAARTFLLRGGCHEAGWQARAQRLHHEFIERRLSPGGCADLLAVTVFVMHCEKQSASRNTDGLCVIDRLICPSR